MNLICELFGHKYDKQSTTIRILPWGPCEVKTVCPRCNKITYCLVIPEKPDDYKQIDIKSVKEIKR